MTRNRKSAKAAGARFEKEVAQYLGGERRVKEGRNDRGDITGVHAGGHDVVLECKNCTRTDLPQWWREAEAEAANAETIVYAVVHKRHGVGDPARQWVTMDLRQYRALLEMICELEVRVRDLECDHC